MARPREFDEEDVLERATRVFWEKGYQGTSLADLLEATGLGKGSLYTTFGDKKTLFLRALNKYLQEGRATLADRLRSNPSGRAAIEGWLRTIGAMALRGHPRRGCFGVNSTVELAPHDPQIRAVIREHQRLSEQLLAEAIARGAKEGAFRKDLHPDEGARFITLIIYGFQAVGRASLEEGEVDHLVRSAMNALR